MVIGITGKMCSGKNHIAALLENRFAFYSIDVDKLGHKALQDKRTEVYAEFGISIASEDGSIDRQKLGALVFSNDEALRRLEAIVHPYMCELVQIQLKEHPQKNFCINAAILFQMNLQKYCDKVIWVDAPFFLRLKRCLLRDKLPLIQVIKRICAQRKLNLNMFKDSADIVYIQNCVNEEKLFLQLDAVFQND